MRSCLPLFFFLLLFSACEKESFDTDHPDVKAFIDLIVEGKYDPYAPLPAFRPDDIPVLLNYAHDFRPVPQFVINPISSLAIVDYRLGECILWTIEAIRQYDPALHDTMPYPSLVPVLVNQHANEVDGRLSEQELLTVYLAYKNWWHSNRDKDFEEYKDINPLDGSDYRWR